jgi:hypothetical protein
MDPVTPTALLTARSALGAADTRLIAVFEPAGTAVALRQGVEVARSAQQQRIDRLLEMAVRAFDRTDLVRYAPIVRVGSMP